LGVAREMINNRCALVCCGGVLVGDDFLVVWYWQGIHKWGRCKQVAQI